MEYIVKIEIVDRMSPTGVSGPYTVMETNSKVAADKRVKDETNAYTKAWIENGVAR